MAAIAVPVTVAVTVAVPVPRAELAIHHVATVDNSAPQVHRVRFARMKLTCVRSRACPMAQFTTPLIVLVSKSAE
jgi:hypothetical protein